MSELANTANRVVAIRPFLEEVPIKALIGHQQSHDKQNQQSTKRNSDSSHRSSNVLRVGCAIDGSDIPTTGFSPDSRRNAKEASDSSNLLLNDKELFELTDYKQAKKQMRELDHMGIRYFVTSQGKVKVPREHVIESTAPDSPKTEIRPNYDALTST